MLHPQKPARRFLIGVMSVVIANVATTLIADTPPRTIAELPAGTFLENVSIDENDQVVLTSYFDQQVLRLDTSDTLGVLADLAVHPVGILEMDSGFVVTAHGTPFTAGPEFTQTQQIILMEPDGTVSETIPVPDARFLNGMTRLADGRVLIADSISGTIWQFDRASLKVAPWLQADMLTQDPDVAVFLPGANGLKLNDDRLLVSNSSRGALYGIGVGQDGTPQGDLTLVAQTGPIDDFFVDMDRIVFATHSDALKAISPDGTIDTIMADGCDACTSVVRRADSFIVLTTGGFLEGHTDPARILEIPVQ